MKKWADIAVASNAEILRWAESQPWACEMAACQQDAGWHAEGDVWTHTKMVCGELEKLAEWVTLSRVEQLKLLFTGLFHDAGKPVTTVFDHEAGRTRSPKHALVGANLARRVLRELECDYPTREEIVALVRLHGRPPYLLEKADAEREVIWVSGLVSNKLLYLFALADTRGRLTTEMTKPEENLHLWKMMAEEKGCFDRPYAFANDQARFLFYRENLSSLHYVPREDYRCRVTLMSGLPGAGKDTWLAKNRPELPVVSLDEIREDLDMESTGNQGQVIQAAREQCREHMREGRDFAFNATNITRQMRQRWIDLFTDYGARIEIVYLEPKLEDILKQNKKRERKVPDKVILRLLEKTEPPTVMEGHEVRVVV
jgi:putative nucleotidyltransferase with HDIG domain